MTQLFMVACAGMGSWEGTSAIACAECVWAYLDVGSWRIGFAISLSFGHNNKRSEKKQ